MIRKLTIEKRTSDDQKLAWLTFCASLLMMAWLLRHFMPINSVNFRKLLKRLCIDIKI